jgi:hypothetical protein
MEIEPRSDEEQPTQEDIDFIAPDEEVEVEVEIAFEINEQMENSELLEELGPIVDTKRQRVPPTTNIYVENRDEMRPLVLGDDEYELESPRQQESVVTAEWYPSESSSGEDEFEC